MLFYSFKCIIHMDNQMAKEASFQKNILAESFYNVNYYVISSSNNLSNKIVKTGVSREMIFQR